MGEGLTRCSTDSASSSPAQSSTPPQRDEPPPFCSPMHGAEALRQTSSGDAAKALVEAWQDAAHHPATAPSGDGCADHGGNDKASGGGMTPGMPSTAEMELRAQLELSTARCAALEEQNSALWEVRPRQHPALQRGAALSMRRQTFAAGKDMQDASFGATRCRQHLKSAGMLRSGRTVHEGPPIAVTGESARQCPVLRRHLAHRGRRPAHGGASRRGRGGGARAGVP